MSDLALRLRTDGYRALEHDRTARGGDRTWETRLLGRRAVVVRGQDGARLFYDESVVRRRDAVPLPLRGLLFGVGAVHGLDDKDHAERKDLFLRVLSPGRTPGVAHDAGARLARLLADPGTATLQDVLVRAYGGAVLAWAGFALPDGWADTISRELARIVDGFGFSATYPRSWAARLRTDHWLRRQVASVRAGRLAPVTDSALAVLAGSDLPAGTVAVELNNVVRPTVAVSWLGTFAAAALHRHPEWRPRLLADGHARLAFAQEVRRTAPFVPALAGRVRRPVRHDGVDLHEGDFLVLDVRAINHDPLTWEQPHVFRPDRFLGRHPGPFEMVPQGGGEPTGHRCPGESLTVQLLVETLGVLAAAGRDRALVAPADLTRIPTVPLVRA
jgi:fatty-acid peroxygenase